MPQKQTIITFSEKEIRDMLIAKAQDAAGIKTDVGSNGVVFKNKAGQDVAIEGLNCTVTFNGVAGK